MSSASNQRLPTPPPPTLEGSPNTCIVGCKLPHGLHLELKAKDGRVRRFTLKGNNDSRIVGGYGLTDGVPTEFMTEWLRRNAEHPAVKNGMVFMHNDPRSAEAHAKERRGILTGLEPLDPIAEVKNKRIQLDAEGEKAYRKQVAENPMRNRQIVE